MNRWSQGIAGAWAFGLILGLAGCNDPHWQTARQRRDENIRDTLVKAEAREARRPAKLEWIFAKIEADAQRRQAKYDLYHPVWCVYLPGVTRDYREGKFAKPDETPMPGEEAPPPADDVDRRPPPPDTETIHFSNIGG